MSWGSAVPPNILGDSFNSASRVDVLKPYTTLGNYTTWKTVAVAVATSNVASPVGLLTIDGVTLALGNKVLLTAQTNPVSNGLYVVTLNNWELAKDFPLGQDASGLTVLINQGTVNANTIYVCTNDVGAGIIGTNSLTFSYFAGLNGVTGPSTSTNDAIAVFNGTTGNKLYSTLLILSPTLLPTVANAPLVSSLGGVLSFNNTAEITVTVILTATQVTGASATPVQLLAAPGAGFIIRVGSTIVNTRSTGNTAFGGGGVAVVQYGNTALGAGTNALSATIPAVNITAATSQIYMVGTNVGSALTNSNAGIYFSNQTAPFTGGAGTTLAITLNYQVLPFA